MANTEAEDRKKRLEKNRELDTLITEETEGGNILEKQVYDVMEYIEKEANIERNPVAIKILKLKEFGITDEQIKEEYLKHGGALENQNSAMANLGKIFAGLVEYINALPNGVVIDLATAEKNDEKSFEQAIQYGIYPDDLQIKTINETLVNELESIRNKPNNEKIDYLMENFKDVYIYNTKSNMQLGNEIEDFLKKNEDQMKISDTLKRILKNNKQRIEESPYEKDPYLFNICNLQVREKETKDKNILEHELILAEIKAFYEAHPDYISKELPVLNSDGTLNKDEVIKMQEYIELYEQTIILEHFDAFNGMTPQELENMDPLEKSHLMMSVFSGLRYENDANEENREFAKESMKLIEQLYPNLDFSNEQQLAKLFKDVSGIKANFESLSRQDLIDLFSHQLQGVTLNYIENNHDIYKGFGLENLNFSSGERMLFDSAMKNYFVGSNIRFSEKDEQEYNELYKNVTVESWIESKENAIKLRYAALTTIRDEYKNNPVGTYTEKKLVEIEKAIKEFEDKYGKVDLRQKEGEVPFDVYRKDFVKAGLTKYLTRDITQWSKGEDYKDLNENDKKRYIRNILVALDEDKNPNSYMTKIALRRLELMGDAFVKKLPNGEYEINKDLILEEYKKYSDYNYPNFEELVESAKLRENEYLLKKLEEYTNLPENAFVKLLDREDTDGSMRQIEETRYISNQKSIFDLIQEGKIKKDKEIIENSPYEKDKHLFEICKLQIMLKDPKNVENTQMYGIILSKIKDFYGKHPEYIGKEIPVLNADGTLNEQEIEQMNQYSEAYQRIIILKHLDTANDYGVDKLTLNERKDVLLCAFAGLKYQKSSDEDLQKISLESMNVIKHLYPQLNLKDEKELAKFFKNEMGFEGNIESISLKELIRINALKLKDATESFIENDKENCIGKKIDLSTLELDSSKRKVYSSVMKNYFVGSKINFTEKDEKKYNEFYQHATIESWIENKENAIKLRYAALTTIRDEYKNNPVGTYTGKKLVEIEKAIKEFEDKYGKIDLTQRKGDVSFDVYRDDFINAGITKYLTRDASDWSDGIDYAELDDKHKKGYIRNILVALENNDNSSYLTKIALRRLELMNSEGKEFVKFNEKGEYKINEKLILEEYKSMSDYKYASYEELTQSAKLRKNEYLLKKLEEYTNLDDKAFLKLSSKKDYRKSMDEIEKARYISNQKRIHEMVNTPQVDEEPKITDSDMFSALMRGSIVEESFEMRTGETIQKTKSSEHRNPNDQEDAGSNNDTTESERKPSVEVVTIDASATKNKSPKFVEVLKNTFRDLKDRIKKLIKGEDEEMLQLDAPKDENAPNGTTVKNTKGGYDINAQFDIDHNVAGSGKNLGGKTQRDQEPEIGEMEG